MSDLHVFTLVIIPKKNVLCGCDAISRMLKWHCDNLEEFLSLYHKHSKREIDIFNNEEKTLFDFEITQDCNAENRACLLRFSKDLREIRKCQNPVLGVKCTGKSEFWSIRRFSVILCRFDSNRVQDV